jgi:hypothetical protein
MTTHQIDTFKVHEKKRKKSSQASFGKPLILLDEIDISYEDEAAFESGVRTIVEKSLHPVILICNGRKIKFSLILNICFFRRAELEFYFIRYSSCRT